MLSLAEGWLQVVSTHHKNPQRDIEHDANRPLDLVLFDMDGTLIEGSSWEMVHAAFGVNNQANWERYQRGELNDHEFMRSDIALWTLEGRDVHVNEIESVLDKATYFEGAHEVIRSLSDKGIATCILSGGLDLLARRVCLELGIDMYVANGLRLKETGRLQGEGLSFVEINDKARTTREILRKLGTSKARTAAVGNSAYDVPMFRESHFGVAFNPSDPWVQRNARHVIPGPDMRPVLGALLD